MLSEKKRQQAMTENTRRITFLLVAASTACFNNDMPTSLTCCREVNLLKKWSLIKSAMQYSSVSNTIPPGMF